MNERNARTGRANARKTQQSKIVTHPKRSLIESDLLSGMPQRQVAEKYGLSVGCVHRYCASKFGKEVENATSSAKALHADELASTLSELYSGVAKLYKACDDWLTDPDNPTGYTLEPRASEIDVIYFDESNYKRRARLQDLLTRSRSSIAQAQTIDTRVLLLKAVESAGVTLERIARMTGSVTQQVDITVADVSLGKIKSILFEELEGYPEILERCAARIALL